MSLLDEIMRKKVKLRVTETHVTFADGSKAIERNNEVKLLEGKSHGFVVDTAPDTVPACILDGKLYLGSQDSVDADVIRQFGISHILSVGIDTPNKELFTHLTCMYLPCLDLPETDLKALCDISNKFISDALINNGRVLVHCNAGVSRSTSVVIGYLIGQGNMVFEQAYELVKSKRPCVQPNSGFMMQLKQFVSSTDGLNVHIIE